MAKMSEEDQRSSFTLAVFGGLVASAFLLATIRSVLLFMTFLRSSEKLHDIITQAVIKSPVFFFDTNPVGRIMNRFSKDIGTMDDILPLKCSDTVTCLLQLLGIVVITGIVNYWFIIIIIPTLIVFLWLCRYYLKTARELSRMEAIRCSPVYDHISESMEGLEVIHCLHMQDSSLEKLCK